MEDVSMKTQKTILNAIALMVLAAPFAVVAMDPVNKVADKAETAKDAGYLSYLSKAGKFVLKPFDYVREAGLATLNYVGKCQLGTETSIADRLYNLVPAFVEKSYKSESGFLKNYGATLTNSALALATAAGLVYGYNALTGEDKGPGANLVDGKPQDGNKVKSEAELNAENLARAQDAARK